MKKNRPRISSLFYNNKIVIVFSILLSFLIWFFVASSPSQKSTLTISDIPVVIALSESAKANGIEVFGTERLTGEVRVTGNRLVLGQLSNRDIKIGSPQSASIITTPGHYTLELTPRKNSILTNYDFDSPVTPGFVTVVADRLRTETFTIEKDINFTADEKKLLTSVSISEAEVEISGPETRVASIAKVVVEGSVQRPVEETTTLSNLSLALYDAAGNKISQQYLTLSCDRVDATITAQNRKTVPLVATFTKAPKDFSSKEANVQIFPKTIEIAGSAEDLSGIKEVVLAPIDLHKASRGAHKFEVTPSLPARCQAVSQNFRAQVTVKID